MNLKSLLKMDISFQWKYGFYFIYAVLTFFYILILAFIPPAYKNYVAVYIIFSDPAAIGLFFMGAMILFEKNQNTLNSLSVSPIKIGEYIVAKVLSFAFTSFLIAVVLIVVTKMQNPVYTLFVTLLASGLFTLSGLTLACFTKSLNQFLFLNILALLFYFTPPILTSALNLQTSWLSLHPGVAIIRLLFSSGLDIFSFGALLLWMITLFIACKKCVAKMFVILGGIKL